MKQTRKMEVTEIRFVRAIAGCTVTNTGRKEYFGNGIDITVTSTEVQDSKIKARIFGKNARKTSAEASV
jgi:hypothetical protein